MRVKRVEYRDDAVRPGGGAKCDEGRLFRRRREDGRVLALPVECHEDRPCEGHEVTRSRGGHSISQMHLIHEWDRPSLDVFSLCELHDAVAEIAPPPPVKNGNYFEHTSRDERTAGGHQ